jgi:hypothetical protein
MFDVLHPAEGGIDLLDSLAYSATDQQSARGARLPQLAQDRSETARDEFLERDDRRDHSPLAIKKRAVLAEAKSLQWLELADEYSLAPGTNATAGR